MLNIVKKVLFYALIAVSILSVINIIILCQFHTQIPLGLYTISALVFVACTFNIYLFIPLCLVICILILLSATSFLREKILLPLFSLVYLSIDLALLFFNFFNAWIIDGFFIAQQAIQLAINAIIFMFLLVYFALIGQKRRSEGQGDGSIVSTDKS